MHTFSVKRTSSLVRDASGFTLLELIIVLAIVGIMAAIAAPSFNSMIKSNDINVTRDILFNDINTARSEAVANTSVVSICASSDQATCTGDWPDGSLIFQDANADGNVDTGERIIAVNYGSSGNLNLVSTSNVFTFLASGIRNNRVLSKVSICDPDKKVEGKSITISATGSIRFTDGSDCP